MFDQLHEEITGRHAITTSVRTFTESWLAIKESETAPATMNFYRRCVAKLLQALGNRAEFPISEITKSDILEFRNTRAKEVSARTANHDLKCIRMIFKAARRDELLSEDPTEFVEIVRQRTNGNGSGNGRRAFTLPELRQVLTAADLEWRSLILFGLYTGQRLGDLALLRWNNIDLIRSEIRLTTRKTGRAMQIPLSAPLRRHIESLPQPSELETPVHPRAFRTVAKQHRTSSLSNKFSDLLVTACLREKKSHEGRGIGRSAPRTGSQLSFHSLRRTATTLLHEGGIPSAVAQAFIGHDSPDVHNSYISVGRAALEVAAAALPEV